MKNYLAIDTSGSYLTVLAVKDGEAFWEFLPDCAMSHSVNLMNAVDKTLEKAGLTLEECHFFAAVVGAGSFTGIRIGISAVKGFCLATGKPSLAVTSFDVAAYNGVDGKGKRLCLVDALHGAYYACGYEGTDVVLPPAYLTEDEVFALYEQGYTLWSATELSPVKGAPVFAVSPVEGLKKAVDSLSQKIDPFGELTALYVRKSSAEINRESGEGKA